ncbi:MAG: hypothetical protein NT018_03075 [Armatimonadetes bacterium]|nr:hypothetical protein [Armatimonadota bacterium]
MLKQIGILSISVMLLLVLCCAALARMGSSFQLENDAPKGDVICTGRVTGSVAGAADSKGYADFQMTFRVGRII